MFVCVCRAVPENVVREVIADGAHSREAVTAACRAGGDCGACHGMIDDMIEDHLEGAPAHACCPKAPSSDERLVRAEHLVREARVDGRDRAA